MKQKRGQVWDTLGPWIIGLIFLALSIFVILSLTGKLTGAGEFLKNLVRFGK